MRGLRITSAFLLCVGFVSLSMAQQRQTVANTVTSLKLTLSARKVIWTSKEPVVIQATVTNSASETLTLPATKYEWSVRREDNRPVLDTPTGALWRKHLHDAQTIVVTGPLDAGKSLTTEETVADLFTMDEPGVYLVSVRQEVSAENETQYLSSNILRITIQ
jgi:hypothetical protein